MDALRPAEVFAIVRQRTMNLSPSEQIVGDLRTGVPSAHLPARVDAVIHLAQGRADDPARAAEAMAINVEATRGLLRYAKSAQASLFLFASTGNVYRQSTAPLGEDDPLTNSGDPYAMTKLAGESLVSEHAGDFAVVIPRLFSPYGPGQRGRMIPGLLDRVMFGQPVVLTNGGEPAISPIHIQDCCAILSALIALGRSATVNVAGNETVNVRQLTTQIADLGGWQPHYIEESRPEASFNLIGRTEQLRGLIDVRPQISLRAGLSELVAASATLTGR